MRRSENALDLALEVLEQLGRPPIDVTAHFARAVDVPVVVFRLAADAVCVVDAAETSPDRVMQWLDCILRRFVALDQVAIEPHRDGDFAVGLGRAPNRRTMLGTGSEGRARPPDLLHDDITALGCLGPDEAALAAPLDPRAGDAVTGSTCR